MDKRQAEQQKRQNISRHHVARKLAMQAIYQWQLAGHSVGDILTQFSTDRDYHKADSEYFSLLVRSVLGEVDELDAQLQPFVTRRIEQVDPVERAILRIATFELTQRPEIPFRVVLNEAISLTKNFGAQDAYKFVNGVLDKSLSTFRPSEMKRP